jgi:perosamine synthetase
LAHDIKEGDEVIVPSFTFIATSNVPLYVGAKPIFADIETATYGLDPEDIKRKISKKTKAIIPIHYGGSPCLIRELTEIAEDYHLLLIEDVAESMGARILDRKVGTFGDSAMLSFCQNKIITTGDGGAIVTDSRDMYERLKLIRSHGRSEPSNYFSSSEIADYVTLGYNYRMPDILAALGIAQLGKINKIIDLRRLKADYFSKALSIIDEIVTPTAINGYFPVYQLYTITVKAGKEMRDRLLQFLVKEGVSAKVYFAPVHLTHFYKNVLHYNCVLPTTEDVSSRVLTLPLYPSLSFEEMDFIIEKIKKFFS